MTEAALIIVRLGNELKRLDPLRHHMVVEILIDIECIFGRAVTMRYGAAILENAIARAREVSLTSLVEKGYS